MLHVEGGEIVRFLSCGGMGHVERGRETVFREVRGGRSGQDSKGKSYQPERHRCISG